MAAKKDQKPVAQKLVPATKRKNLPSGAADPNDLKIVGLDSGYLEGEPGFDEELLDEPERLVPPDDAAIEHCIQHGPGKAVEVIEKSPGVYVVVDGRQTVMATRAANRYLLKEDAKAEVYRVNFLIIPFEEASALHVCRANQYAKRDPIIVNARRAARMLSMHDDGKKRYTKADVIGAFSDESARPISKQTLDNWLAAARCAPDIQAQSQPFGPVPVNILYTVGKAGDKTDSDEVRFEKQRALLTEIIAKGAKGDQGAKNASAALRRQNGESDDPPDSDSESESDTEALSGKGGKRASAEPSKTLAFPPDVIHALSAALNPVPDVDEGDGDEPEYDDSSNKGRREYEEGDFQRLAHGVLQAMTGEEEGWWTLRKFPSVYRYFKKYDPTSNDNP